MIPIIETHGYCWLRRNGEPLEILRPPKKRRVYKYNQEEKQRRNEMNKIRYRLNNKKLHYKTREKLERQLNDLRKVKK